MRTIHVQIRTTRWRAEIEMSCRKLLLCWDPEPDAPESMLKGMRGYQLTEVDLEFIKKTKEQQVFKKLQGDLQEVQKRLKKEMFALDLAYASRKKGQDELDKFPSCEDLTTWSKLVIRKTTPSVELDHLGVKSLVAMVTTENIQSFMDEKKRGMDEMKRTAGEKERDNLERDRLEKQVVTDEMKIQKLMREWADLKSGLPEQKVEKSAEPRAAKSKAKQQERQEKAAEGPQKLITGKSTRRGHVDETNTLRTISEENRHQKPGALLESKPLKASTKKPRRVEKEEVPERAAGGRQKPADSRRKATLENNPKESHQESHCGQEAEEQPHCLGLRRSKRIANRK
ncbi:uncharacterized protein [Nothobranchius furzeri]|uniref:uncharacterized protein n=1 Tax=Nothobranchius furzeri TaxID=105023 RepID=UPI00240426DE|nr:uncharacterized protein LOC129163405 [Nothobranchius furzeri]